MQPHLVEEFIRAFHSEINRLEKESNVKKAHELAKHERVVRQLDGLYEAIADGLRTPGLKSKLEELEKRKIEFETQMAATPTPQPTLHPNLAEHYRRKVEDLHSSLNSPDTRTEAAEVLRDLIEVIKVRNLDKGFEMELVGEIANMVELAQTAAHKGKAASKEAANLQKYRSSVKVVAGVGFEPTTFRL